MLKKLSLSAVAILMLTIVYRIGPVEPRVIAATLVNLTNQVIGILAHGNGGTDVSSPGTLGNVLTSTGSAWASSPPSGGGSGSASTGTPNPKARRWSYCAGSVNIGSNGGIGNCSGDLNAQASAANQFDAYTMVSTIATPMVTFGSAVSGTSVGVLSSHPYWGTGQNLYVAMLGGSRSFGNTRIRLGFSTATTQAAMVAGDTDTADNIATFRYSTNVPDTHWICETSDGTTESTADSGITPVVDTAYLFEIKINDSVPNVVFSINGSTVCTITSHLPSATTAERRGMCARMLSTTNPAMFLGWIYTEADK